MKKLKMLMAGALLISMLAGCTSHGLSPRSFVSAMESSGYVLEDVTEAAGLPDCRQAYQSEVSGETQYRYYYMSHPQAARSLYSQGVSLLKDRYESREDAVFMEAMDPGSGRFRTTLEGCEIVLYQQNSTLLYVRCCTDEADPVKKLLRTLGY